MSRPPQALNVQLRPPPNIDKEVGKYEVKSVLTIILMVPMPCLVMDRHLTFEPHIDQFVARSTGALMALSHARHVLPRDTLVQIVSALVLSSIRYCIALYGTHGSVQLPRVQKLINFCARVVNGRRCDHVSDVVRDLRWLSADQFVRYHNYAMPAQKGLAYESATRYSRNVHSRRACSRHAAGHPATAS